MSALLSRKFSPLPWALVALAVGGSLLVSNYMQGTSNRANALVAPIEKSGIRSAEVPKQWDVSLAPYSNPAAGSVDYPVWLLDNNRANPTFDIRGGIPEQSGPRAITAKRRIQWGEAPNTLALEFETDAPQWELLCAAAPAHGGWRVFVRDVGSTQWQLMGDWKTSEAAIQRFRHKDNLRKPRRWRVEHSNQLAQGVRLQAAEKIAANRPEPPLKRVVWVGDSYAEGTGAPSLWQSFAGQAGALLGMDSHFDAAGGTGYIARGPSALQRKPYGERMENITQANPSVVVVYGSINDGRYPVNEVAEAARKYWAALHQALPNAQIIAIGPARPKTSWDTRPLNQALQSAAMQSNVKFVDASSWSLSDGSPVAANTTSLLSTDGVHPTLAGHTYLAQKTAEALRPILQEIDN